MGTGAGPAQPPPPAEEPPADGAGAGTGGPVGSADCPNPADHCLPEGDLYFVATKQYKHGYVYVYPGDMRSEPDGAGVAQFFLRKDGSEVTSQWFYRARPATPEELAVGKLIVMFHDNKKDRIYGPPSSRERALGRVWWMGRITSLAPLASNRYVLVNGYKIAADNIRLIEGDKSPTARVEGAEDAHFLKDDHWLISSKKLKDKGYTYVHVGAPVAEPSSETRGEGHFIDVYDGSILWTAHAWKTRPANKDDLELGTRVFMFHDNKQNKVYQKPSSRDRSLGRIWWSAKITDTSSLYKGVVTVAGRYQVAVDALRVAR